MRAVIGAYENVNDLDEPTITIVSKMILRDAGGRILVLRRSSTHPTMAYQLDFPGGGVEVGETPLEAALRELNEETDLVLEPETITLAHERKSAAGWDHLVYVARLPAHQPDITISWEHDQFEWLHEHELLARPIPENVDPYFVTVRNYLLRQV